MAEESKDVVMTIRIPNQMARRIQQLRPFVERQRAFAMKSTVTRSDLVRYALLRGIEELEDHSESRGE